MNPSSGVLQGIIRPDDGLDEPVIQRSTKELYGRTTGWTLSRRSRGALQAISRRSPGVVPALSRRSRGSIEALSGRSRALLDALHRHRHQHGMFREAREARSRRSRGALEALSGRSREAFP